MDVSKDALAHASAKFSISKTFTSIEDMLADAADVDLVMITSAE